MARWGRRQRLAMGSDDVVILAELSGGEEVSEVGVEEGDEAGVVGAVVVVELESGGVMGVDGEVPAGAFPDGADAVVAMAGLGDGAGEADEDGEDGGIGEVEGDEGVEEFRAPAVFGLDLGAEDGERIGGWRGAASVVEEAELRHVSVLGAWGERV